jgi:biotin synthase-related radical SAM superfamily protein
VQFEPPTDLGVLDEVAARGIDSVGIHVESFDPEVLQHVAPAKARTGIERYFATWERAVALFGEGQVSTYVILGMGEDPELTVQGCRRAVDMGVLPFVVPLRPVAGSLMQDVLPPDPQYTQRIYRKVASYMLDRGVSSATARAGCARCQACSGLGSVQRVLQVGRRPDVAAGAG